MNGLRLYVRPDFDSLFRDVFYSQRSHGPIYRWRYEKECDRWRVARMHQSDVSSQELCAASWKSLPQKLRTQLSEHYLE